MELKKFIVGINETNTLEASVMKEMRRKNISYLSLKGC